MPFWNTRYRVSAPPSITSMTGNKRVGAERNATRSPTLNNDWAASTFTCSASSSTRLIEAGVRASRGWPFEDGVWLIAAIAAFLAASTAKRVSSLPSIASRSRPSVSASRYDSLGGRSVEDRCAHLFLTVCNSFSHERASRGRLSVELISNQF